MIKKIITVAHNVAARQLFNIKRKKRLEQLQNMPIRDNKVLFNNFGGKGYGCNPKYIAEELLRHNYKYDLVWLVESEDVYVPAQIRKVKMGTDQADEELATAKVVVTNIRFNFKRKKKGQYMIQTWHGFPYAKTIEGEAEDKLPQSYVDLCKKNSAQTDLVISDSKTMTDIYKNNFWYNGEIMECGFPRNDVLFSDNTQLKQQVRDNLGVMHSSRLVLYAPTFRNDNSLNAYTLDCRRLINTLSEDGEDWRLVVRLHPNAAKIDGIDELFGFDEKIINATFYPDVQELMLASDVLISDFSSVIYEFASMKKPVYIFAPDFDEYQKTRDLRKTYFEMPHKICRSNDELMQHIKNTDKKSMEEQAQQIMDILGNTEDGKASEKVAYRISQVVQNSFTGV